MYIRLSRPLSFEMMIHIYTKATIEFEKYITTY